MEPIIFQGINIRDFIKISDLESRNFLGGLPFKTKDYESVLNFFYYILNLSNYKVECHEKDLYLCNKERWILKLKHSLDGYLKAQLLLKGPDCDYRIWVTR